MRSIARKIILIILASLVFPGWLDPYRDEVSKGNSRFHDKQYSESKSHYNKAEQFAPGEKDKQKLSFNKGDAAHMLGDYENAITSYQKAIQSQDRDVQKKAFFNMGNTYLKMKNYKEAVNAYINALKLDPEYDKARKNIEYILKNKMNEQDKKEGGDQKGGEGKDDKSSAQKDKNQNSKDDKQNQQQRKNAANPMSREQIKNVLESMKNKPVRRVRENPGQRRSLEKDW